MPRKAFWYLVLAVSAVVAAATVPAASLEGSGPAEEGVVYTEPQDIGRPNRVVVIEVSGKGTIKIELYDNMTPITADNFADLADSGFYNGIKFHRCIDDFVAQTGDPNTKNNILYDDGMGGSGTTIPLEICRNASHIDGAVGMARSTEPDSASSQFYICDGPQHGLDDWVRMESSGEHGYAVFGVVIEGLDIAKAIAATETYGYRRPALKDHPVDDIVMTSVTIEQPEWENATENGTGRSSSSSSRDAPAMGPLGLSAVVIATVILIGRKRRSQ